MSMLELFKRNSTPQVVEIPLSRSKMVSKESVVNGVLVDDFEFVELDSEKDERNNLHYQDFCLSNLKKLGVLEKQQKCMLQRDDVDLVCQSIEISLANEPVQTPPQNP